MRVSGLEPRGASGVEDCDEIRPRRQDVERRVGMPRFVTFGTRRRVRIQAQSQWQSTAHRLHADCDTTWDPRTSTLTEIPMLLHVEPGRSRRQRHRGLTRNRNLAVGIMAWRDEPTRKTPMPAPSMNPPTAGYPNAASDRVESSRQRYALHDGPVVDDLRGRPRQAEVVAQCRTGVLGAEPAATLQDWHDMINECRKFMWQS